MDILIIGNGFDLAHKLPTRYSDFLAFCNSVIKIYTYNSSADSMEYQQKILDDWKGDNILKYLLKQACENRSCEIRTLEGGTKTVEVSTIFKPLNELFSLIENNVWFKYFLECPSYMGENWIDFESEISRLIQMLDDIRRKVENGDTGVDFKNSKYISIIKLLKAAKGKLSDIVSDKTIFDVFISRLEKELHQLIRALEIYLEGYVSKIIVNNVLSDIKELNPDCVLSFNYTNTYKRLYGWSKTIEYSYIHGKSMISNTIETNNMVLGIDEYLDDERKNHEFTFLPFKKFYQRLLKTTDKNYISWADKIKDEYEDFLEKENRSYRNKKFDNNDVPNEVYPKHNLYIFGHSLDITDKDILKLFICNDNVQTKIFYYRKNENDKSVLGQQITNLIKIMGQDELVRRTGGRHKSIEFVPQTVEEK